MSKILAIFFKTQPFSIEKSRIKVLPFFANFMIIKNAAFTFHLLTNKLSRSKAFEPIECSKWANSNGGPGFARILKDYNRKIIRIGISRSFLKKIRLVFMLIKE